MNAPPSDLAMVVDGFRAFARSTNETLPKLIETIAAMPPEVRPHAVRAMREMLASLQQAMTEAMVPLVVADDGLRAIEMQTQS